jgi:branched-chain amino acid transport system permease protein
MLRADLRASRIDVRRQWAVLRQWPASDLVPLTIFLLLAVVPALASLGAEIYLLNLFTRVMIFAIAALALDLIVGYGALVSFGHAAFIGLGAYTVGILAFHGMSEILLSLPLAIAVSGLFAIATGVVCLRTRGIYFIMITLAFGQMAFFTASSLAPYGGDDGLTIHARNSLLGFPLLRSDRTLYYVVLLWLLGSFFLCRAIVLSRFGRVLRGARENPTRMAAIGFEIFRYQLIAYAISGALAGLSGFLLANAAEFVSPAYMSWQRSGELIIMVLFGGMGTLYGAIIGAAAFLLTEEWLSGLTEHWKVIFGPLLVIVVVFARGGLVGLAPQVVRALRDDPLGRGSAVVTRLRADLVRRVSLGTQSARRGLIGFGVRLVPLVRAITARIATLPPVVHTISEHLAARLTPILQAYREAFARGSALASKLGADISRQVSLSTQGARRSLVAFAARVTPMIQVTTTRTAELPPGIHPNAERLVARLTFVLHAFREAFARGSTLASKLSADIVRRVSLSTQGARRSLVAFAARVTPVIRVTTTRMAALPPRVRPNAERLVARLTSVLHAFREAFARGSALASKLSADIVRRVSLSAQDARRGLAALAVRLTPIIQEGTDHVATLSAHVYTIRNRLSLWLAPMLHSYREAFPRLTRRLVGEIAGLRSELTRRLRGG